MKAVAESQNQAKSAVAPPKQPADNTKEQQVDQTTAVPSFGFDMAQLPILPPNNRGQIQAKLRINAPNDRYEQEADRIADQVMRMKKVDGVQGENPAKQIQQKPLAQQISRLPLQAQRKCNNCGTCSKCQEEKERIQRKAIGQTPSIASAGLSSRIQSTRGSGRAMDASTSTLMSSRFGTDFSGVRIHTDTAALQMSQEINARAFTVGRDVYFNKGEYQPNSARGQRLLAHELTHVIQQSNLKSAKRVSQTDEMLQLARNCEEQQIECFRECYNGDVPWPFYLDQGSKYRYCQSKCLAEYMICVGGNALESVAEAVFTTMSDAMEWLAEHPEIVVGTIVLIGAVAFVVATGGAGAPVLLAL